MICALPKNHKVLLVVAIVTARAWTAPAGEVRPPPNAPAEVRWDAKNGTLSLRYHGVVILDAKLAVKGAGGEQMRGTAVELEPGVGAGETDKVEQRLKFTSADAKDGAMLVLRGTVTGSDEAFPAETADCPAQKRFPLVRNSVGLSHNLRNNAIYNRRWDWVLTSPAGESTRIQPMVVNKEWVAFSWESRGSSIELVFRPRFYQKHRGLAYFEPWNYRVWQGTVTGYCSWWPYRDGINQQVLDSLVDVFAAKKLPDVGYKYLQLDAGYWGGAGGPQSFLEWNKKKFPGGAEYAVKKVKSAGMSPGIWVHRVYRSYVDRDLPGIGKQHPDWFVTKADGSIFQGGYGVWTLNTSNNRALDAMVRPLFCTLRQQGWDYVKIDGAGDMMHSDGRSRPPITSSGSA